MKMLQTYSKTSKQLHLTEMNLQKTSGNGVETL